MIPLSYNFRSLAVRKATTGATAGGVALVVFVFASAQMLAQGVERTLGKSGSEDVAIVLSRGADAELSSNVDQASIGLVKASREVRQRSGGIPDAVAEIVGVLALDKVGTTGLSNVQIRGVEESVFQFRPTARVTEGRAARPGADEAVVGASIRGRFVGLEVGQSFEIRKNRRVTVVGVFEDGGSSFESEVWTDLDLVRAAFGRAALVSSVRVRLRSPGDFDAFKRNVEENRQLGLQAIAEPKYYADQSEGTATFVRGLGFIIAFFFSIGAMIGAMITMYAAVANRSREIGTLRALGFSKLNILFSFLLEAIVLSLIGGAAGAGASLLMGFVRFSVINFASWSEIVFTFVPTVVIVGKSVIFAGAMGLLGGFFPAIRAARVPILAALRG